LLREYPLHEERIRVSRSQLTESRDINTGKADARVSGPKAPGIGKGEKVVTGFVALWTAAADSAAPE